MIMFYKSTEYPSPPPVSSGIQSRTIRLRLVSWIHCKSKEVPMSKTDPKPRSQRGARRQPARSDELPNLLAVEEETYRQKLPQLLDREGQQVVIKGREIVGTYPTFEAAFDEATKRYGAGPYLIRQITPSDPVVELRRVIL
jgi:hypothetical protein